MITKSWLTSCFLHWAEISCLPCWKRKLSFLGLGSNYSLSGMAKHRLTECQSLKRLRNLLFWGSNSQIKKIYMQDPTFQLVGKRRTSSFKRFVQTYGLNDFSLEFIKREVTWASSVQDAYFRTSSPGTSSTMLVVDCLVMSPDGFTPPCIHALGKFPIYLLWVWPCDLLWPL